MTTHSKPASKPYTKKAIAEYAKQRGLTHAQGAMYAGMLLHDSRFAYDTTCDRYYHVRTNGTINRQWQLHTTTARGIINAGVVDATPDKHLIRYALRPDARPPS
jgi:hypothetical protein